MELKWRVFNEMRKMAHELVSADSKGLVGKLNPLLCITFELHKDRASLGRVEGEIGTTDGHG
jgi:hypothetical protein